MYSNSKSHTIATMFSLIKETTERKGMHNKKKLSINPEEKEIIFCLVKLVNSYNQVVYKFSE